MKKLESSLTNMALVLTIIAVVAGAALAAVNAVTAPQIEKINADNLAAGIKEVMGSDKINVAEPQQKTATVAGKEKTFIVYDVTDESGAKLGKAVQTSENGFGGELQVLVGFDQEFPPMGFVADDGSYVGLIGSRRRTAKSALLWARTLARLTSP